MNLAKTTSRDILAALFPEHCLSTVAAARVEKGHLIVTIHDGSELAATQTQLHALGWETKDVILRFARFGRVKQ